MTFDGEGGKRSAWMSHVKKTMKANKGKSLMQVLKMAKKTYKKSGGGAGGVASNAAGAMEGGRRRRRGGDNQALPALKETPPTQSSSVQAAMANALSDDDGEKFTPAPTTVRKTGGRKSRKASRKGGRRTRKH